MLDQTKLYLGLPRSEAEAALEEALRLRPGDDDAAPSEILDSRLQQTKAIPEHHLRNQVASALTSAADQVASA